MFVMSMCSLIYAVPLEGYLKAAAKNNFDQRETTAVSRQREGELQQNWGKLLPSASITATYTRNQQSVQANIPSGPNGETQLLVINALNQLDANFTASVPLIDVAAWIRTAAAVSTAESSRLKMQSTGLETERQVARAYYALVAAESLVRSTERNQKANEDSFKLQQDRQTVGLASELDVRRSNAEVQRARQNVSDAYYSLAQARRQIETLSGLKADVSSDKLEDSLTEPSADEATLAHLALVQGADRDVQSASRSKAAAWVFLVPTLTLQGSERYTNAPGFGVNPFWSVAVKAQWTLDAAGFGTARQQAALATVAEVRAERTRRQAFEQLDDARELVKANIAKSRAATAQLESTQFATKLAKDRFVQGKATQLDVIQAERDELDAEVGLIRVNADLKYARALLQLSQGRSLL